MATTNFTDKETVIEAAWLNDVDEHVYDQTTGLHSAANVANTPAGNIAATDVQAALNELDSEKAIAAESQRVFATVAAMVADADFSVGDRVVVEDYATGNNSGVLFGSIVAAATGTDDGGSYIDLAGSSLQFKQNFPARRTVKMFGAAGDNTNATAAFVNAIASLPTASPKGGVIGVPGGSYQIDVDTVSIPEDVYLQGDGILNTRINGIGAGIIFRIGNNTTAPDHIQRTGLRGMSIQGETTAASTCIHLYNAELCTLRDLQLGAGSVSVSGGGGACLIIEATDNNYCQFNFIQNVRCAAAAGSSIKLVSSAVGGAYNTSSFFNGIYAVGSGATAGERILTIDSNSSSHAFSNCYFEPSDALDCGVRIYGKNTQMVNVFIDGHPGKTALQIEAAATDTKFIGNVDGDIVNNSTNAMIISHEGMSTANDVELMTQAASTQSLFFKAGASGDFGFKIRHDRNANELEILNISGGVESKMIRINRNTAAMGFYGADPIVKPNITGSRAGNAALADLLTKMAAIGLVTDNSTV